MWIWGDDPFTTWYKKHFVWRMSCGHLDTYLSLSILNQSQKEQLNIVEHNIWIRLWGRRRLTSPWLVLWGVFQYSSKLCWGCSNEIKPFLDIKHLTSRTSHTPPPPLFSAHWLSQIISVLDDRINRIILSQCLLSQNCMVILLVDRNNVSISKQEIIYCLLCGAENSTG